MSLNPYFASNQVLSYENYDFYPKHEKTAEQFQFHRLLLLGRTRARHRAVFGGMPGFTTEQLAQIQAAIAGALANTAAPAPAPASPARSALDDDDDAGLFGTGDDKHADAPKKHVRKQPRAQTPTRIGRGAEREEVLNPMDDACSCFTCCTPDDEEEAARGRERGLSAAAKNRLRSRLFVPQVKYAAALPSHWL